MLWPRDLVYVGHMLDMARKAVSKTQDIIRMRHMVVHDYLALTRTSCGRWLPTRASAPPAGRRARP
jgi:hypothetical protein